MAQKSIKRLRALGNGTLQARVPLETLAWVNNVIFAMQHDMEGRPTQRVMTNGEIVEMALKEFRSGPTGMALTKLSEARMEVIKKLEEQGLYEH